jgi:hypothetical protein
LIGSTLSTFTDANHTCTNEKAYLTTVEDRYGTILNLFYYKPSSESVKKKNLRVSMLYMLK